MWGWGLRKTKHDVVCSVRCVLWGKKVERRVNQSMNEGRTIIAAIAGCGQKK